MPRVPSRDEPPSREMLEIQLDNAKAEAGRLRQRVRELEKELDARQREAVDDRVKEFKQHAEAMTRARMQAESAAEADREKVREYSALIDKLEGEMDDLSEENKEMRHKWEERQQEIHDIMEQVKSLPSAKEVEDLKLLNKFVHAKLKHLESLQSPGVVEVVAQKEQLQGELHEARQYARTLMASNERQRAQVVALETKQVAAEDARVKLGAEARALEHSLHAAEAVAARLGRSLFKGVYEPQPRPRIRAPVEDSDEETVAQA